MNFIKVSNVPERKLQLRLQLTDPYLLAGIPFSFRIDSSRSVLLVEKFLLIAPRAFLIVEERKKIFLSSLLYGEE